MSQELLLLHVGVAKAGVRDVSIRARVTSGLPALARAIAAATAAIRPRAGLAHARTGLAVRWSG